MTYGLESSQAQTTKIIDSKGYSKSENPFNPNFNENGSKIQEDLAKIINRWTSLPSNIKLAIMVLIAGTKEE